MINISQQFELKNVNELIESYLLNAFITVIRDSLSQFQCNHNTVSNCHVKT